MKTKQVTIRVLDTRLGDGMTPREAETIKKRICPECRGDMPYMTIGDFIGYYQCVLPTCRLTVHASLVDLFLRKGTNHRQVCIHGMPVHGGWNCGSCKEIGTC